MRKLSLLASALIRWTQTPNNSTVKFVCDPTEGCTNKVVLTSFQNSYKELSKTEFLLLSRNFFRWYLKVTHSVFEIPQGMLKPTISTIFKASLDTL